MNTTQILELIKDGATIENNYLVGRVFVVHPSFTKGKRIISDVAHWSVKKQCKKLNIPLNTVIINDVN